MKFLFIDFTLPYFLKDTEHPIGGWAIELAAWLRGIADCNQQAGVLTWRGARKFVGEDLDFELIDTYDPKKGVKILKYFYSYIPTALRAAKAYEPNLIIQACSGLETGIMAFISGVLGVPFVYRVANDMDADKRYKERLSLYKQLAYRYGLRKAAAIICQNQYQYDCFRGQFPDKPIHIIHNPFQTSNKLPKIHPRGRREYIAWIGVFSYQKNLRLLYRVAASAPDIEFRVAGMPYDVIDRETALALEDLVKLDNVKFVGYLKRRVVPEFLAGAIALLNTSRYEGFSNTFLESLSVGTPVIAPKRVDPDQIIGNYNLGLTAGNDGEFPGLIERICNLAGDDYGQLAARCQHYVREHHAPEAKVRQLLEAITPLIQSR